MNESELKIGGLYKCRLPQWRRTRLARLLELDSENQKALMRMVYGPYDQLDYWVTFEQIKTVGEFDNLKPSMRRDAINVCAAVNLAWRDHMPTLGESPEGQETIINGILLAAAIAVKQLEPLLSNEELADKFRAVFVSCLGSINVSELQKVLAEREQQRAAN
jgi:hypothetical protein